MEERKGDKTLYVRHCGDVEDGYSLEFNKKSNKNTPITGVTMWN